jgi:hypothetical protein
MGEVRAPHLPHLTSISVIYLPLPSLRGEGEGERSEGRTTSIIPAGQRRK